MYRDGEEINGANSDKSKYSITYNWSGINVSYSATSSSSPVAIVTGNAVPSEKVYAQKRK